MCCCIPADFLLALILLHIQIFPVLSLLPHFLFLVFLLVVTDLLKAADDESVGGVAHVVHGPRRGSRPPAVEWNLVVILYGVEPLVCRLWLLLVLLLMHGLAQNVRGLL